MIVATEWRDYASPVVDFGDLVPGAFAFVAGTATNCRVVRRDEDVDDDVEIDAGTRDELETALYNDKPLVADRANDADSEPEASEEGGTGKKPIETWAFDLTGMRGSKKLQVEVKATNVALRELVDMATRGLSVFAYGLVEPGTIGCMRMSSVRAVNKSHTGRIYSCYPSKDKVSTVEAPTHGARGQKLKKPGKPTKITKKLSSETVGDLVQRNLPSDMKRACGFLRARLRLVVSRDEWGLLETIDAPAVTLEGLIWQAHYPSVISNGARACLALQRLQALEVLQSIEAERREGRDPNSAVRVTAAGLHWAQEQLYKHGRIVLGDGQELAVREALADMWSDYRMRRLLSGDVGTGKTLVFGVLAATIWFAGGLTVMLSPSLGLAQQTFEVMRRYWPDVPIALVTGQSPENMPLPATGFIVGTTGVWTRIASQGLVISLIVADEQHKFGVKQRQPLRHVASNVLECTATPIPRSQGLVGCGGMAVTQLRGCHVVKTFDTKVVFQDDIEACYAEVIGRIARKGNAILVYPTIYERESDPDKESGPSETVMPGLTTSVLKAQAEWEEKLPGQVAVVHGKMDDADRANMIKRFDAGEFAILIATSVVEVGMDFRNATQMVIHQAERFGAAALHQLRGRLVRRGGNGHCYLATTKSRVHGTPPMLSILENSTDGFEIAEADMARRGVGDMLAHADKQSGKYEGFLVGRPPLISDLEFVIKSCERWIGRDKCGGDLLEGDGQAKDFMKKLGKRWTPDMKATGTTKGTAATIVQTEEARDVSSRAPHTAIAPRQMSFLDEA
jgi:ATP-dependent DNA helicase RecG